jgi:hypothetical protein
MGQFKVTMCASTLGVDDTLWNTLTIKVGEEIEVVEVLEEEWAGGADALSCVRLCDRCAVRGGVNSTVFAVRNLSRV